MYGSNITGSWYDDVGAILCVINKLPDLSVEDAALYIGIRVSPWIKLKEDEIVDNTLEPELKVTKFTVPGLPSPGIYK